MYTNTDETFYVLEREHKMPADYKAETLEEAVTYLKSDGWIRCGKVNKQDYSIVDMSPSHWAYKVCLKATSAYDDNGYVSFSKRQENIRNKLDEYNDQLLY